MHGDVGLDMVRGMQSGRIVVHGDVRGTAGTGLQGGCVLIRGNSGYRSGVGMRAGSEHPPYLLVGGRADDHLGASIVGGTVLVLGVDSPHESGAQLVGRHMASGNERCVDLHKRADSHRVCRGLVQRC